MKSCSIYLSYSNQRTSRRHERKVIAAKPAPPVVNSNLLGIPFSPSRADAHDDSKTILMVEILPKKFAWRSSTLLSMYLENLPDHPGAIGRSPTAFERQRIFARVGSRIATAATIDTAKQAGNSKKRRKKCQQNCQQNCQQRGTTGVQEEYERSTPVLYAGTSFFA
jgi:hypothetical protein